MSREVEPLAWLAGRDVSDRVYPRKVNSLSYNTSRVEGAMLRVCERFAHVVDKGRPCGRFGRDPTVPPFIPLILPEQKMRDKNIDFSKIISSFWNVVTHGTPPKRAFMTSANLEISVKRRVVLKLDAVGLLVVWSFLGTLSL